MRFLVIAAAAALVLLSTERRASACEDVTASAQVATVEYSAEMAKKPVKKAHRKKHRQAKEKVEYMRAAPMK